MQLLTTNAINSTHKLVVDYITKSRAISQLPKLCVKISILMHRRMWVHSFSTRLTSMTFAEDKVLIFLILRKNASSSSSFLPSVIHPEAADDGAGW